MHSTKIVKINSYNDACFEFLLYFKHAFHAVVPKGGVLCTFVVTHCDNHLILRGILSLRIRIFGVLKVEIKSTELKNLIPYW